MCILQDCQLQLKQGTGTIIYRGYFLEGKFFVDAKNFDYGHGIKIVSLAKRKLKLAVIWTFVDVM